MNELRVFTKDELVEIMRKHALWLADEEGGKRADLSSANLRYADLRAANLSYADLSYADLSDADLSDANLRGADLRAANLRAANLRAADLSSADLSDANLILIGQDIRGFLFWAFVGDSGAVEIRAGCHHFIGLAAARAHWTKRHTNDPILHDDCLSLVDRCERMATVSGWELEPEREKVES